MRIGIFGGSFNPPHNGHLNSLQTVLQKTGLEKIFVVPTSQNPLKYSVEGPSAADRLEMVKLVVNTMGPKFEVDDQEIKRGGINYTIETLQSYIKSFPNDELYLIMGLDAFESFPEWKDFKQILNLVNLIVTSRPGMDIPATVEELPPAIQVFVKDFDFNIAELKTEKNIQFVSLKDVEASSTELRKKLRVGKNVGAYLPLAVESFIKEKGLYKPLGARIADYEKMTVFCANILFERKGIQVKAFDLRKIQAPSEYSLICSGTSTRHCSGLAELLIQGVKDEYGVFPLSIEGIGEGRWVLLDYGSVIVHIFYDFIRSEYALEKLWKDAQELKLEDPFLKAAKP